jgi:hypothetical protein
MVRNAQPSRGSSHRQTKATAGRGQPSYREVACGSLFILIWLIPIVYVGLTDRYIPYVPIWLAEQYRISDLFSLRIATWSNYYLEARIDGVWRSLDDRDFFNMQPFGHQTRLDLLLADVGRMETGPEICTALASYIVRRYKAAYPQAQMEVIRAVEVAIPVGDEIARPTGAWSKPPLAAIPLDRRTIIFEQTVQ